MNYTAEQLLRSLQTASSRSLAGDSRATYTFAETYYYMQELERVEEVARLLVEAVYDNTNKRTEDDAAIQEQLDYLCAYTDPDMELVLKVYEMAGVDIDGMCESDTVYEFCTLR